MMRICLIITGFLFLISCHPKKEVEKSPMGVQPPIIIYKTKKDYKNNVPVILSDDKTKIVSFPSPGDLIIKKEPALPVDLGHGYLLDRRGITKNVAFTSYTYEEYTKLKKTPSTDELYAKIIDKKPLKRMYVCGSGTATDSIIKDITVKIEKGDYKNFQRIK